MSMKNFNDTIGNRSSELPVCSAVAQPLRHRVPPRVFRCLQDLWTVCASLGGRHQISAFFSIQIVVRRVGIGYEEAGNAVGCVNVARLAESGVLLAW
jgi:hypothetical protein